MVTYLYWFAVLVFTALAGWVLWRLANPKVGLIAAAVVFVIGWCMYTFHYQQILVKHWGGVMSVSVPEGQLHIQITWKDDNLWIENYDPKENTCYFSEYSKGNLLEGQVVIKNCNPARFSHMQSGSLNSAP